MRKILLYITVMLAIIVMATPSVFAKRYKENVEYSEHYRSQSEYIEQHNRNFIQDELRKIYPNYNHSGVISDAAKAIADDAVADMIYKIVFDRDTDFSWDVISKITANGAPAKTPPYQSKIIEGKEWFQSLDKQDHYLTVYDWKLFSLTKLHAYFIPNNGSTKTAVLHHGYRSSPAKLGVFAKLFYEAGYNLFLPSSRATGKSGGKTITFGWREKNDLNIWLYYTNRLVRDGEIILGGSSLGASTVMMASGLNLPNNVKVIIADCGYTSLSDELVHLYALIKQYAKEINITLPDNIISLVDKKLESRQRFSIKEVSAVNQLKKSTTPTLFIHGMEDTFVPWQMLQPLYDANSDIDKDILRVQGAGHAEAIAYDYYEYVSRAQGFISLYVTQ